MMKRVSDIRSELTQLHKQQKYVTDKGGSKTVEIIGATFVADEEFIIAPVNEDYVQRELQWYESQSLFVDDIPGETPKIWKQVSSAEGKINSNYGWCIYSEENGNQYESVVKELKANPFSRRAVMIYNRPSMHTDYSKNGMSDFICTFGNSFHIRDDKLFSHVIMRSNDARFGYNNDRAWFLHVLNKLANEISVEPGEIIWTASSLHVYERDFKYLEATQ